MALLGADRLGTINQPARPDACAAGGPVVEQTKPLRAAATPRANKHRPEAAVPEAPDPDTYLVLDPIIDEPDSRGLRVPPNLAKCHQGRHANHRQIVDRALHRAEN
jgi:hypothetical protein